jgi:spore coat protein H
MRTDGFAYRYVGIGIFFFAVASLLGACAEGNADDHSASSAASASTHNLQTSFPSGLNENRIVYDKEKQDSVINLYLTLTEDNKTAEEPINWAELNRITYTQPEGHPEMSVIFQEGDENGPESGMFGYEASYPNGIITIRGQSSLRASQKSYKIKLTDNAGRWNDQETINLIKHAFDFSRIRNRLSFDYFKLIPNFTSLRTQFVHLHVKDLSGSGRSDQFEDYGLYEQIEQPNKSFLRTHGLDPYGQLYKPASFEFYRYPDKLKLATDPEYDKNAFESVLEIKGSNDHEKLLAMLEAVNDTSQDIDDVLDRYFDRDNFMTWMAVNILMDNTDTNSQNFMLYSPLNSAKWYFLPWDYDGAWGIYEQNGVVNARRPEWHIGIQNYWGSVLQQRVFKNPKNVDALTAKIKELGSIVNAEQSRKMIGSYKKVTEPFIRSMPDIQYLDGKVEDYDKELERIIQLPEVNKQRYLDSLEKPMPVFMGVPEKTAEGGYSFAWDNSYDLQGDVLHYSFELAKDPTFAHPIVRKDNLPSPGITIDQRLKGHYFWRVRVIDEKGNEMSAFDEYEDESNDVEYDGVREFYTD